MSQAALPGKFELWNAIASSVRTLRDDQKHGRCRRVVLMLIFINIISVFDLLLTLTANQIGGFEELNPIGRLFIHGETSLWIFKLGSTVVASLVLLLARRKLITEVSCAAMCIVYTTVACMWSAYFGYLY